MNPPPVPNSNQPVWELVIEDMKQRDHVGRQRYGTPLQVGNGRDALQDLYEELLDAAVYIRQAIEERKRIKQIPLNDDTLAILGRPNFACAGIAMLLRKLGHEIPEKAEREQAHVIHWMLCLYEQHGSKCWEEGDKILETVRTKKGEPKE